MWRSSLGRLGADVSHFTCATTPVDVSRPRSPASCPPVYPGIARGAAALPAARPGEPRRPSGWPLGSMDDHLSVSIDDVASVAALVEPGNEEEVRR